MAPNYYQVLGLERSASQEQVRKAYKRKALETHPDKLAHSTQEVKESAAARFRDVHEAFQILSNPYQRRAYDIRTQQRLAPLELDTWVQLDEELLARTKDREEWARQATLARRERMAELDEARRVREAANAKKAQAVRRGESQHREMDHRELDHQEMDHQTLVDLLLEELCKMNPEWEARREAALRRKAHAARASS